MLFQMLHLGHILVIQHSCMTLTEELFRSSFELLTETHVLGSNYPFKSAMQKFSE